MSADPRASDPRASDPRASDPSVADPNSPQREDRPIAAARDVFAGLALLVLGRALGGSSVGPEPDGADIAFDLLGVGWMLFGFGRLAWMRRRKRAAPDQVSG